MGGVRWRKNLRASSRSLCDQAAERGQYDLTRLNGSVRLNGSGDGNREEGERGRWGKRRSHTIRERNLHFLLRIEGSL